MAGVSFAMSLIDVTDSEFLCLAIVLISFFGAPILAEMIASAICKIKIGGINNG